MDTSTPWTWHVFHSSFLQPSMCYVVREHQRGCIYCSYCLRLKKSHFGWFIVIMAVVTSRAFSRLRIPQFCQSLAENTQINRTEAWQTFPPPFPASEGRVRTSNLPEVTHTFAEKFTFNQHLPLPPSSTYENLLGKITVYSINTQILSYSSSLFSWAKDRPFLYSDNRQTPCPRWRPSLLVSTLISASRLLWPLLKASSMCNCTLREMSASDPPDQFLPVVI